MGLSPSNLRFFGSHLTFSQGSRTVSAAPNDDREPLSQNLSFLGLNLTQFLGVFNDNLFRQLVMLLCLDWKKEGGWDLQSVAMALFAVPFLLVSGFAGFLSDRYSKRNIIVLCKAAEVVVVSLGMIGFITGQLWFLLFVLLLMGFHSAFFGPSKYGILPELLRDRDLPRANGLILMATFLAIIFGLAAAGATKHQFSSRLWLASLPCFAIAALGLISSLAIRKLPPAQPHLKFDSSSIVVAPETRQLLKQNPTLLGVLCMSSVFWFVGGMIYPPTINSVCKLQFQFNDLVTGVFAASTGVGIAIGCVTAGLLSHNRVRASIVKTGAWGITISLMLLALPGPGWSVIRNEIQNTPRSKIEKNKATSPTESLKESADGSSGSEVEKPDQEPAPQGVSPATKFYRGTLLGPYLSVIAIISVGVFAGFYSVPLQVYLQSAAPMDQKGRVIGANNLLNWIGIFVASGIYAAGNYVLIELLHLPYASLFGLAACLMLPVAIFYRPPDTPEAQT